MKTRSLQSVLFLSLTLAGCAGGSTTELGASETSSKDSDVELGAAVHLAPTADTTGTIWRGAMSWQPPASWQVEDRSSRPFVAGEYTFPGHSDERPAGCRISNGEPPKEGEDFETDAEKLARRFPEVKTAEGKSLRREVDLENRDLGSLRWVVGTVEGSFYDDGNYLEPRDPPLVIGSYAGRSAVPLLPGPPFSIRCWGPATTLHQEQAAIEAWLETFVLEALE